MMNTNIEHVLAVVEPTFDGESTLAVASSVIRAGGRATLLVLLDNEQMRHVHEFAESEELSGVEAEAIYGSRLAEDYFAKIGSKATDVIFDRRPASGHAVIATAVRSGATSIAIPQSLAGLRTWRRDISSAPVSVTITPSPIAA